MSKILITDDDPVATLKNLKGYCGDPPQHILDELRIKDKSERRNKSDRKRAPKWGRR